MELIDRKALIQVIANNCKFQNGVYPVAFNDGLEFACKLINAQPTVPRIFTGKPGVSGGGITHDSQPTVEERTASVELWYSKDLESANGYHCSKCGGRVNESAQYCECCGARFLEVSNGEN